MHTKIDFQKKREEKVQTDGDRREWSYWVQCTNENMEKIILIPQVLMNDEKRVNESNASREVEGGKEMHKRKWNQDLPKKSAS